MIHNPEADAPATPSCPICGTEGDCPWCARGIAYPDDESDATITSIITTMVHAGMSDDDTPADAPGSDCPDHGPSSDDDCPKCLNCSKAHHTWRCPEIYTLLFAPIDDYAECSSCGDLFGRNSADPLPSICSACREIDPVVMVMDTDFAPVGWPV